MTELPELLFQVPGAKPAEMDLVFEEPASPPTAEEIDALRNQRRAGEYALERAVSAYIRAHKDEFEEMINTVFRRLSGAEGTWNDRVLLVAAGLNEPSGLEEAFTSGEFRELFRMLS